MARPRLYNSRAEKQAAYRRRIADQVPHSEAIATAIRSARASASGITLTPGDIWDITNGASTAEVLANLARTLALRTHTITTRNP